MYTIFLPNKISNQSVSMILEGFYIVLLTQINLRHLPQFHHAILQTVAFFIFHTVSTLFIYKMNFIILLLSLSDNLTYWIKFPTYINESDTITGYRLPMINTYFKIYDQPGSLQTH